MPTATENMQHHISDQTRKRYQGDLEDFMQWNGKSFSIPIPSKAISEYLTHLDNREYSISTIERRMAALSWFHDLSGLSLHPAARMTIAGIKRNRKLNGRQLAKVPKTPLNLAELTTICCCIDTGTLSGKRDKALILVGFFSAMKRSELVSLTVSDINITNNEIVLPGGIHIPRGCSGLCPIEALIAWYSSSYVYEGFVFRRVRKNGAVCKEAISGRSYADILKKYCDLIGLDATQYSSHSTRSGMISSSVQ